MSRVNWKLEISLGHLLTVLTMIVAVTGAYFAQVTRMDAYARDVEQVQMTVRGIQADAPAMEGRLTRIETRLDSIDANMVRFDNSMTRLVDALNR